ncbi:F-box protein SKIP17 isoform X2 [Brassica napus]|uniref:F-box protein SKIP17 isoform X2 n=1 Tax=Brassica napus TaxID=3708 RepID=UPI00207A0540|nr:F-box protein SKIP17 isoform X2 [Brassica napus]
MSLSCCWSRSKQKSGENKTLSTFSLMDPPTSPAAQNPSSLHSDSIISSLLSFPASTPFSIACSFDRELEKALASASDDASVQDRLLNRTIQLASLLLDSTERCFRKRASAHNSVAWVLPPELTVKVFSKLDTKSLMQAAACCTMFNKCAMDRSSYAHIDLTTADNEVVCTMIHRAGKELRSIKLGHVTRRYGPDPAPTSIWFNGPFLSSLAYNNGFLGSRLRSLRLYNIRWMTSSSSFEVFSFCSNLTDLRIVGSNCPFRQLFMTLTKKCRLIEHLCLGTYFPLGTMDASTVSHLIELVTKSPNLTSLTLLCFQLTNEMARNLVESCRKLKYLNFSRSPKINGHFLRCKYKMLNRAISSKHRYYHNFNIAAGRDLGNSCKESPLQTLVMRNCVKLEEKEVLELCNTLLKGNFKFIRHIDVSSNNGLVSDDGRRSYKPKFPVEKLKEERPDVTLVADFPLERSGKRYHVGVEGDDEELKEIEMMEVENDEEDDDDDSSEDDDDDV